MFFYCKFDGHVMRRVLMGRGGVVARNNCLPVYALLDKTGFTKIANH